MKKQINTNNYYKPKQLKLPLEIEKIIEISDPVYSFCENERNKQVDWISSLVVSLLKIGIKNIVMEQYIDQNV